MTSPNKRVEALTSRTLVDYLVPSKASGTERWGDWAPT